MRSAPQESCGVFVTCNIEGGATERTPLSNAETEMRMRRSAEAKTGQGRTGNREPAPAFRPETGTTRAGVNTKAGTGAGRIPHTALPARRSFTGLPKVRARLPPRNPAERAAADSGMRPVKRQKGGFQQRTESRDISHGTGFQQVEPLPEDTELPSAATDRMTISRTGSAI